MWSRSWCCSAGQGARRAVNSALVTQTQLFDHLEGGELDWEEEQAKGVAHLHARAVGTARPWDTYRAGAGGQICRQANRESSCSTSIRKRASQS